MFRFRELSLWNWDYWGAVRVPLDREVVLLSGPNGSGKTTLLDAVRQLLHAPRLSSRRRLQHYLRRPDAPALIRAVVSNEDSGLGQPFRRERITTPEVTLACALLPTSSGAPEKRFAVLPGRASLDELRARLLESRGEFLAPERYTPDPRAGRRDAQPHERARARAGQDQLALRANAAGAAPGRPRHDG